MSGALRAVAVVPSRNGRRWLPGCLAALRAQTRPFVEVVVVDDASTDGSVSWLAGEDVRVVTLAARSGFAAAANRGIAAAPDAGAVALVNTDVELAPDWLERALGVLEADAGAAAIACKMMRLDTPGVLDDAGDVLRRDGVCEQRGRGRADDGRWDTPGEVFSACAGAALYRRAALMELAGFDERYGAYLEDVDLGLRLRLAGWRCRYEPAVARHAGGGSSSELVEPVGYLVARNTLVLVAKAFPLRWAGPVLYRQLAWIAAAARGGTLGPHLRGLGAGFRAAPGAMRARRDLPQVVSMAEAVPPRPWRGPEAGGHPRAGF